MEEFYDNVTPSPFNEPSHRWRGSQKLWFTVFSSGLERFIKLILSPEHGRKQHAEYIELEDWFFNDPSYIYVGSFLGICENLDLSSALIRKYLRKYMQPEGEVI